MAAEDNYMIEYAWLPFGLFTWGLNQSSYLDNIVEILACGAGNSLEDSKYANMDYLESVWNPVTDHMRDEMLWYTWTFGFPLMHWVYMILGHFSGLFYMVFLAFPLFIIPWMILIPFVGLFTLPLWIAYFYFHMIMTIAIFWSGLWAPFTY